MSKRMLILGGIALLLWMISSSSQATEIAAGVAIFLVGMIALEEGFQAFTGGALAGVLRASTDRLWKSLGFGLVATAIMQSSSLVSLLAISFLSAGLIDLTAGIGIIFGSNIGTTTGAWLIAGIGLKIDIAAYALPMLVAGVVLNMQSDRLFKGAGSVLAGIGFVFLGISYMKAGFDGLQSTIDLSQFSMTGFSGVLVYSLIGIIATVIMQSSHAALMVGITALAAGQITYENSLAIAIGSNIGTTVTALIGATKANVAGKRLALAHLIFNVVVGSLAILFIETLRDAVDQISNAISIAPDDYTLKFAVFHTLFNLIGVVIMTPLIAVLIKVLVRLVPEKAPDVSQPKYLSEAVLALPDTSLRAIKDEVVHFYGNAFDLMATGLGVTGNAIRSARPVAEVIATPQPKEAPDFEDLYQRRVKSLYSAITEFAVKAETGLLPEQVKTLQLLRAITRDLVIATKGIKHLNKNLRRYSASQNTDIAAHYRREKSLIVEVLRALDRLGTGTETGRDVFDEILASAAENNVVENGDLDRMIRQRRITPEMATSIINDIRYREDVLKALIQTAMVAIQHRDPTEEIEVIEA